MMLKEGEPKQEWDKIRTLRMLGIGAFFSAPFLHMWFNVMQRIMPGSDVVSTVKKVLAGQILASPIANSAFFAINSFLQGVQISLTHTSTIQLHMCYGIIYIYIYIYIYIFSRNAFIFVESLCNLST
jgi:hypothetical protein